MPCRPPSKGLWLRRRKWTFLLWGFSILTEAVITIAIAIEAVRTVRSEMERTGLCAERGAEFERLPLDGLRRDKSCRKAWPLHKIFRPQLQWGSKLDEIFKVGCTDGVWNFKWLYNYEYYLSIPNFKIFYFFFGCLQKGYMEFSYCSLFLHTYILKINRWQ